MKIEINNLSKLYHKNVALEIEHLSLDAGCVLGLVGNNGAGKTTLLRLILDLIKANSGRVLLNGLDVHRNEGWKQHTGSYMDEGFLIPFLTPEEYFLFIARNYNLSFDIMEQRLNLFHSFFAGEILNNNKYIRDFSLGNKRKIGIAGALAVNPKLLILDEPFANL
ncbi:MAG: ABC-2 type transport system ATP-binding protein, partial [Cyclobacteriaceae bacterium]